MVAWPCTPAANALAVISHFGFGPLDDTPRVWWPASPDAPERVWTLPLTLWQTLWADLDTALDIQTDAWSLARTPAARRRAVAEAAVDVVHRSAAARIALAVIRLGPDDAPTGAGVWLLPDTELPSSARTRDWLRSLRRAWDSGAPVAGDPPRLPLVGEEPTARRLTAPVWCRQVSEDCG
ncbi:hypothetical protein [Embleya sp. NPDC059259]|uniref:hypothetical protein n=1 Tax=unclassified Embleya TaxID=2699296 RepID=UPI00369957DF